MNSSSPEPTFIIAGAARSGTTSLYSWLEQHPQVFMSPVKETNYFAQLCPNFCGPGDDRVLNRPLERHPDGSFCQRSAAIVTTWSEYLALFADAKGFVARGEASPSYLYYPNVAENIRRELSDCKIIILLRNPIERTFSNYKVLVRGGRESLELEAALQMEDWRLEQGWEHFWALKGLGRYLTQVRRYLDVFSREQVGVWLYEELKENQEQFYHQICRFIAVDLFTPDFTRRNTSLPQVGAMKRFLSKHTAIRQVIRQLAPTGFRSAIRSLDSGISGRPLVLRSDTKAQLMEYFYDDIVKLHNLLPELNVMRWLEE